MQIDWNEKMRPKGPRVRIVEENEKPTISTPPAGKRKLWEALPAAARRDAGST